MTVHMTGELLKKALSLNPKGFELLVLRLLTPSDTAETEGSSSTQGAPGDGGIDVIISQDPTTLPMYLV